jgi:hypothetical protein
VPDQHIVRYTTIESRCVFLDVCHASHEREWNAMKIELGAGQNVVASRTSAYGKGDRRTHEQRKEGAAGPQRMRDALF